MVLAVDGRPGCLRLLFEERPQLVVMDLSAGPIEGAELCRVIREMCDVPIFCLAPRDRSDALVACLEAGADSGVTKPVGGEEFNARVLALLRRTGNATVPRDQRVAVGDIVIDLSAHRVTRRGVAVALAPREFDLLSTLAEQPGCVVLHEDLLSRVWGHEFRSDTHYLRLYVRYLRQKLEDNPRRPQYILTERGVGYTLSLGPAKPPDELESSGAFQTRDGIRPAAEETTPNAPA